MNKHILLLTLTAIAIAAIPSYGQLNSGRPGETGNQLFKGEAFGGNTSSDNVMNTDYNPFTIADGVGSYVHGWNYNFVTLTLTNNLTGFIRESFLWNSEGSATDILTINSTDTTTVDGKWSTETARTRRNQDANALYNDNRHGRGGETSGYTLKEGIYIGNGGNHGGYLQNVTDIDITGSTFLSRDTDNTREAQQLTVSSHATEEWDGAIRFGNGLDVSDGHSVTISNRTKSVRYNDYFLGAANTASFVEQRTRNQAINSSAGHGLVTEKGDKEIITTIKGGDFFGGASAGSIFITGDNLGNASNVAAFAAGGSGAVFIDNASATVEDGYFVAGSAAGTVELEADHSYANANGGRGIWAVGSSTTITDGEFIAGGAGTVTVTGTDPLAKAIGGHGIEFSGTNLTIFNATSTGAKGGKAFASGSNSVANAMGGNGVYATSGTITIHDGVYSGAAGGSATADDANADGGSGVRVENATHLTINGGVFSGAAAGTATGSDAMDGRGVSVINTSVEINDASGTNTVINDGIYFSNSEKKLDIQGGTINEDIVFDGTGASTFTVSSNAVSSTGIIIQNGGTVTVISEPDASSFFKDVQIDGKMDFTSDFTSTAGSVFTLAGSSEVEFNSLTLTGNSRIQAGYGLVDITGGNLVVADGSSMSFSYDGLTASSGRATVSGSLIMTNESSFISLTGAAATTTGSVQLVTAGGPTVFGANSNKVDDVVSANLGWLTKTDIDSSTGITIDFEYNSLTNSVAWADFGDLLPALDDALTSSNSIASGVFYDINRLGEENGAKLIRYSETQLPDVADSAFQTQLQVAEQIAARGTEFRSMNGFASTKPSFGTKAAPSGVAGPAAEERSMQGWIRAYGAFGSRDRQDHFTDYDSTVFGSVIGIDKSFGNILIGLAGGLGATDIDASDTYKADVKTYHGSVYSTLGGESAFVDLALTYGAMNTETKNVITEDEFDSYTVSGYIGAGKSFKAADSVKVTPEASLLVTYYEQEEYNRAGLTQKTIQEYDEWSYLGAVGVNVASQHQIDWLNRGLAMIPEIRAHWLHEFNSDLDDFSYIIDGGGTATFGVRPRDEDLLKLGLGFDIWNWKYQSTKFEVDYDGLFSFDYSEHILSGKITCSF